ncbi:MAG: thioredoxin domain-containing protein [Xanthomonadales bacterium]|nr:thioredoxin domain-containing protein [Xanthomonadales bacterium]
MNRLQDSSSLYLRQHADNPVHWQPWDEAALAQAREQGRPVLLSIGYSACHWCHVMAHESFEDPATAELMNRLFVNIKVDREERPDLDKLYQLSHQLLTGRGGGWPLTVFLDPTDHGAFFAGTYFPPEPRHGMPAFQELLHKIRDWFDANRGAVTAQNRQLQQAIEQMQASASPGEVAHSEDLFQAAYDQFSERHDTRHGGFGGAPKFPQAPQLALLDQMARSKAAFADGAITMLDNTLEAMALGGLRDHLDGGFFRYTVDGAWTIPHFEKMLYDNAQLLPIYASAAARSGKRVLAQAAEGIGEWLLTEMRDDRGCFHASVDADADGVEGGYHVWDRDELRALVGEEDFAAFARSFGIDEPPNFEGEHWHLRRRDGALDGYEPITQRLRTAREERIPPETDRKILTAWNALCITGLARAGVALQKPDWINAAQECWQYLQEHAWRDDRLYAVIFEDQAQFPAYLDDHAFLLEATLALLQARWTDGGLPLARRLAQRLAELFEDPRGGFCFTASDQPSPVTRLLLLQDDATPNGNASAAMGLLDLAHLDGDAQMLERARQAVARSVSDAARYPLAHATALRAHDLLDAAPAQVLILGSDPEQKNQMRAVAARHDRLNCFLLPESTADLPALIGRDRHDGPALALVCRDLHCLPPATSPGALERVLAET